MRHTPVRYLGDSDVRDEGVELVGRVLVLVPQPGQADAHPDQHTVMDPDQVGNSDKRDPDPIRNFCLRSAQNHRLKLLRPAEYKSDM